MGRVASALALALLMGLLLPEVALAHDCSSIFDCLETAGFNAVVALVGGILGIAAGIFGGSLAGAAAGAAPVEAPPAEPETPPEEERPPKEFEPRDKDDCGEHIYALDRQLNSAITAMKGVIDARSQAVQRQNELSLTAAEARLKLLEVELQLDKLRHIVVGKLGWAFVRWVAITAVCQASVVYLLSLGVRWATIAAWGIKVGRWAQTGATAYNIGQTVEEHWQELGAALSVATDLPVDQLAAKLPEIYQMLEKVRQGVRAYADALSEAAEEMESEIQERGTEIEGKRGEVDGLWESREQAYQTCLSRGLLPAGTWHRPRPEYDLDSQGAIIGVF